MATQQYNAQEPSTIKNSRSYLNMALEFFSMAPRGAQTTIDEAEGAPNPDNNFNEQHHYLTAMSELNDDNGDETEEIEDLRMIKRGNNFPSKGKKRSKKESSDPKLFNYYTAAASQTVNKEGNFKRHKSHQNMGESTPIKKESGSDELDVDEKVVNKAPIEKSHGCRSFKKPTSSKSSNNLANNYNSQGGLSAVPHDK